MSLEKIPKFLLNFSDGKMAGETGDFYEFKGFRLEPRERRLFRLGDEVAITPKAFDVLLYLVENAGHLVEKDDLMRSVWADSFVEEANLSRIVHTLRKILGEDSAENKFIETIARKGYRFVAPVERKKEVVNLVPVEAASIAEDIPLASELGAAADEDHHISLRTNAPIRTPRYVLVATACVVALTFTALLAFDRPNGALKPASIAVLPLQPMSSEKREANFELPIADGIVTQLSQAKGLTVRPISSTWNFLDLTGNDVVLAGREQKVDYVLASRYQIVDGRVRVTSQLVNVESGAVEDTFRSELEIGNAFETQDAIASSIGRAVVKRFGSLAGDTLITRGTANDEAYYLVLQATYLLDKRTAKDIPKAFELLDRAVAVDPNFAKAFATKAYAHRSRAMVLNGEPREEYERSMEAINTALRLDPNSSDAYAMLGEIKDTFEFKFDEADAAHRRSVELDPESAHARRFYAFFLMNHRRYDESVEHARKNVELEPGSAFANRVLGQVLFHARQYDEAIFHLRRLIDLDPNFRAGLGLLWRSYYMKGDLETAYKEFRTFIERGGTPLEVLVDYDTAYASSGWPGVLRKNLEISQQMEGITNRSPGVSLTEAYAMLGDRQKAIDLLEESERKRSFRRLTFYANPIFDELLDEPRYRVLLKKLGLI